MAENYSVLMSVYYKENPRFLREAIESILRQTVKTNDFVIVKDGPLTAELDNVINEYVIKYSELFNVVILEKNMGLSKALNNGIIKCKNDIVARMDSDDVSLDDRIERQLAAMKEHNAQIVSGTVVEFDGTIDNLTSSRILPETDEEIRKFAQKRSPFNHPAVLYRKRAVLESGLYAEYKYFEDYNLWATMLNNGYKGYNIKEPLLYMRAGESMYKRRGGIRYIRCIFRLKKHLKDIGFISTKQFLYGAIAHSIVSIMPNSLRTFVYTKFLRK